MKSLTAVLDVALTNSRSRFDQAQGRLVGGECGRCGAQSWPRRSICYRCGAAEVSEVVLVGEGWLTTWTRVSLPVEGLEAPYVVGMVKLGRVQLFGHIRGVTEDIEMPAEVVVKVDPGQQPPFWFEIRVP